MSPSLRDVARMACVSVTTASYVLNNRGSINAETRSRVRKAMAELGYVRRTPIGGMVVFIGTGGIGVSGLYEAAAEYGMTLAVLSCHNSFTEPPEELKEMRKVAGILIYGGLWKRSFLESIAADYPTVFLGGHVPTVPSDSVWVDNAGMVYEATIRLLNAGHTNIALMNGPMDTVTSSEKTMGFERALRHAREYLGCDVDGRVYQSMGFDVAHGRDEAREVFRTMPGVTAVIACESGLAKGLVDECRHLHIQIPQDLSVIGTRDDDEFSTSRLQLSSFRFPERQLALEAVSCLERRMVRPKELGRRIIIQPEFIDRGSISSDVLNRKRP